MLTTTQQALIKADIIARLKTSDDDVTLETFYNTQDLLAGTTTFSRPKEDSLRILVQSGDYFAISAARATNPVAELFFNTLLSASLYTNGINMADPDAMAQCAALVTSTLLQQTTMDAMTALCTRNCTWAEQLLGWGGEVQPRSLTHLDIGKARLS